MCVSHDPRRYEDDDNMSLMIFLLLVFVNSECRAKMVALVFPKITKSLRIISTLYLLI